MNKRNVIITIISVLLLSCLLAFARTTTTDLTLVKPTWTENIDILDDINANSDLLEAFANDPLEFDSNLERLEDRAGAMWTGNTETFIALTYQDADNTMDAVVPVKDEDDMASDSATFLCTQQSTKAYVDTLVATYQPLDTALTNISALAYVSPSFIKLTADDTYAVRTLAETLSDIGAEGDLSNEAGLYGALSDVSDFVQAAEANSIDSVMYVDGSIDHEHLAPDVISGMADVTSADADYILIWDATDSALKKVDMGEVRGGGGSTFVALTDTPANYTGSAGKYAKVNVGETALEFATAGAGETNTVSNIGANVEIYKQKTGVDFELRTLKANSNQISISTVADDAVDVGSAATNRGDTTGATHTFLLKDNPANASGTIDTIEIWANTSLSNCEVATIYLVSGDNYTTRDTHTIGSVTAGSKQTFSSLSITVETGDFLAIYYTAGTMESGNSGYDGFMSAAGDNIPCTDTTFSTWSATGTLSLYGSGAPSVLDYIKFDVVESEIRLDDLKATEDNTDLDASTTAHGLLPKLPNAATQFLDGTGAWNILAAGDIPTLNLTSFVDQTAWRVFYSNTAGDVTELALGTDGQYLKSNGAAAAPTWASPAGGGDVSKVGTPADSQVGVWTGDGTIEGAASLTYDGSNLQLTGDIGATGSRITKGWFADLQVTNAIAGSITGVAATATALATGRNIGGVSFDGTANITPANITIADESADTTCFPLFVTAATGGLPPKSGTNLAFNSSSGVLTATGFAGALTGNVTGDASGSSGSCTGNAATCTTASAGDAAVDFFGAGVDAVTDATTCTDIEGTLLAIAGGTLNAAIPADHITFDMMQDTTGTDKVLGRSTAAGGTIEEIACTAAGRAILDDANAAAQIATLGAAANGANTDITSMLNAALYVGRDADNTISFATDNHIIFKTSGATNMEIDSTGEIDMNANAIGFTLQTATGDGTTTIDWKLGNKFRFTFGSQNDTLTFTAPTNPCTLMLTIIQDGTGSRTITWPATVKWTGGTAPTLTTTANARDKVALDWDGTQYDGVCSKDFK